MGWYITIQQEMRDLGLKGNELIVFAFINGYSQEGQGCYYGSLAYLQGVCGISSRKTAITCLKSLVSKGLLIKAEEYRNGVKYVSYSVCEKITHPVQKLHTGCAEITHNNKDININNTLSNKAERFAKPSLDAIRDYCRERGNGVDADQFYNFYESNGWKVGRNPMKDWKAAVRTWEKREKEIPQRKSSPVKRESVYEHNLKVVDQMFGTNYHQQAYGKKEDADEQ